MTAGQTGTMLGAVAGGLVAAAAAVQTLAVSAPAIALLVAVTVPARDGVSLAHRWWRRLRWLAAVHSGQASYRSGPLVQHRAGRRLPGVLAGTRLATAEDGIRGRLGPAGGSPPPRPPP